ncbi:MAG: thioredoxin domain-containing protein [Parafilimonas terrae]|nr:thioredoxin domain-containing protein [Parafilimonas terrae]
MPSFRSLSALALALGLGVASPVLAQDAAAPFTDAQRTAIEGIVKDYLIKNPDVLQEVIAEAEKRQVETQRLAQAAALKESRDLLLKGQHDVVAGNPAGDVTLIEFFDYNCGYCRKALGDVQALIKSDPKLRVVIKDFPVLGPESLEASEVAMAVAQQIKGDKLFDYHQKLLESKGRVNGAKAIQVAKEMGLDTAKLQKDMVSPEVKAAIAENRGLGDRLGLSGTPAFIVGDEVIPGAVGVDPMRKTITDVRQCGHASC